MIDIKKGLLIGLLGLVVIGCSDPEPTAQNISEPEPQSEVIADNERAISRDSYAGDWAFTDDSGVLGCIDSATYFDTGGDVYGLSGFSRVYSDKKGLGWLHVTPEQPFWLDDPDIEGAKISVGNMISDAMALCGE